MTYNFNFMELFRLIVQVLGHNVKTVSYFSWQLLRGNFI